MQGGAVDVDGGQALFHDRASDDPRGDEGSVAGDLVPAFRNEAVEDRVEVLPTGQQVYVAHRSHPRGRIEGSREVEALPGPDRDAMPGKRGERPGDGGQE